MSDIIMRQDGWYWIDEHGNLIGPYETRGEAVCAGDEDEDVFYPVMD
jgi:hypothetical protein